MRLFVVSDIHGYAGVLKSTLDNAGFDPADRDHLLVCCGDLFDRGAENLEVLRFFERLDRKVMIMGNHEERLIQIINSKRLAEHDAISGVFVALREFFGEQTIDPERKTVVFSGRDDMIGRIRRLVGDMRDYYETEHYIFVHGWLPNADGAVLPDWRNASVHQWSDSRKTWWNKGRELSGMKEQKTVICGHYPTPDAGILYGEGFIALDAGTDISKQINVLVLEDNLMER